jgi:hypothetical protein
VQIEADETSERKVQVMYPINGAGYLAVEREEERDGMLRDCVRGIGRNPRHGKSELGCGREIDAVKPGAPQSDMFDA